VDEKVFSVILDLMQLESSFVSTDINAVYRTRTYVRESIKKPILPRRHPLKNRTGFGADHVTA
jgi:hypothetical protein